MEPVQKDRFWPIWIAMTVGVWGITAGALFLLVDNQSEKFWLTLGTLLFAEGLGMIFGLGRLWRHDPATTDSEAAGGNSFTSIVYALGVFGLALVALTAISFRWLAALHLIWFTIVVLGFGLFSLAGQFLAARNRAQSQTPGPKSV